MRSLNKKYELIIGLSNSRSLRLEWNKASVLLVNQMQSHRHRVNRTISIHVFLLQGRKMKRCYIFFFFITSSDVATSLAPTRSSRTLLQSFPVFFQKLQYYLLVSWRRPKGNCCKQRPHYYTTHDPIADRLWQTPSDLFTERWRGHKSPSLACPKSRLRSTSMGMRTNCFPNWNIKMRTRVIPSLPTTPLEHGAGLAQE